MVVLGRSAIRFSGALRTPAINSSGPDNLLSLSGRQRRALSVRKTNRAESILHCKGTFFGNIEIRCQSGDLMMIHVARQGEKLGAYDLEDAKLRLRQGSLTANDLAWYEGAADWMPIARVPG
jgi:hypothetical protein